MEFWHGTIRKKITKKTHVQVDSDFQPIWISYQPVWITEVQKNDFQTFDSKKHWNLKY